jgi:hypothetical protein
MTIEPDQTNAEFQMRAKLKTRKNKVVHILNDNLTHVDSLEPYL